MAATTTAQAPPQQAGQQKQQQQPPSNAKLIALIIAAFLAWHTAGQILAVLRKPFRAAGISAPALQAAIGLVLSMPLPGMEGTGPATRWAIRTNQLRRAAFTLSTARRVEQAVADAQARGEPVIPAIQDALKAEQRFFAQHVAASGQRVTAASAVDGMAAMNGNLLGWKTFIDKNTTAGCLAANGKSFRVDDPPVVEGSPSYPGAVHAKCRCSPQPPRRGAPVMPGLRG